MKGQRHIVLHCVSEKEPCGRGGDRVPPIACWPGKIAPNTINDGLFISLDIIPTLLEMTHPPLYPKIIRLMGAA